MKRIDKFFRTIPTKLYILLAAIVIFAFFSNDFGLVDIQKTAIILAAGVDKSEEGYTLTAQIAVPKGTDRTTGGTSSVNVEGKGETVSDCIAQIYTETGWVPKLVFCDLIVLGEETAKGDVLAAFDYFLRNEYMPDSCHIAVCEGTAKELLSSASAIDDASSLAVGKLFSDAAKKSGRVEANTLREFAIDSYGVSASSFMPYIRKDMQAGNSGDTAQSGGSGGGSSGGTEEEEAVYRAAETALFANGKLVALLSEEETFAFSLLKGNVFAGSMTTEEDGKPVSLTVLKNKGGVSLDMKGAPEAKLSVSVRVRLVNRGSSAPIDDIAKCVPSEQTLQHAKEKITQTVTKLWSITVESECDLFALNRSLYRSSKKKYEEWKDTLLSVVSPDLQIQIDAVD